MICISGFFEKVFQIPLGELGTCNAPFRFDGLFKVDGLNI